MLEAHYGVPMAGAVLNALNYRLDARTIANTGDRSTPQRVMKSPWKFRQHGRTGQWVSELFPEMAKHVDDLCFVHSMQTEGVAHGPATLFLHCGSTNFIRPSMGAWIAYGLGTEAVGLLALVLSVPAGLTSTLQVRPRRGPTSRCSRCMAPATTTCTSRRVSGSPPR